MNEIETLQKEIENLKKHNARLQRKCKRLEEENCAIHNERLLLRKNNESLMEAIKLIKKYGIAMRGIKQ